MLEGLNSPSKKLLGVMKRGSGANWSCHRVFAMMPCLALPCSSLVCVYVSLQIDKNVILSSTDKAAAALLVLSLDAEANHGFWLAITAKRMPETLIGQLAKRDFKSIRELSKSISQCVHITHSKIFVLGVVLLFYNNFPSPSVYDV